MKTNYTKLITLLLLLIGSPSIQAQGTWTSVTNFPPTPGKWGTAGFEINGKIYVGTGYDGSTVTKAFWEYDPATDTWTQKADFGGNARFLAVGFAIEGKGYITTGSDRSGNTYKDLWEYNPTNDSWTQKADLAGSEREAASGFTIGGKGYVVCGSLGGSVFEDLWEYNPGTDQWTQKADYLGEKRRSTSAFVIGDSAYVGSGNNVGGSSRVLRIGYWAYSPTSDTWTQKANLPGTRRWVASSFAINGAGYVGAGLDSAGNVMQDFWKFDPSNNTWSAVTSLTGVARSHALSIASGNKGYIISGYDGSAGLNDAWEYSNVTTGIRSITTSNIDAYPNPNHGSFHINLNESSQSATVEVYDLAGRKVDINYTPNGHHTLLINLDQVSRKSGIFLVKISTPTKLYRAKVFVQL